MAHQDATKTPAIDAHSQIFLTDDGRDIGFGEFGAVDGNSLPIIYLHGLPGSRFEARLWEAEAIALNMRLIALDRPGIGLSTRHKALKLTEYPKDVAALVTHLKLDQYHLLAVSGGGPFGMACAAAKKEILPGLQGVGIVAGLGPRDLMGLTQRLSFLGMDFIPQWATRWLWDTMLGNAARSADPTRLEEALHKALARMKPQDAALCKEDHLFRALTESMRAAFAKGSQGYVDDAIILSRPWGFDLAEAGASGGLPGSTTRSESESKSESKSEAASESRLGRSMPLPVSFWYGSDDDLAPSTMGEALANKVPGSSLRVFTGETHFCTIVKHQHEILTTLCGLNSTTRL